MGKKDVSVVLGGRGEVGKGEGQVVDSRRLDGREGARWTRKRTDG